MQESYINKIINADCIEGMKAMPDNSVDCCITSPPYFGLRDYLVDGQIGLEPTLPEYIQNLVAVFREVKRVLKSEGTLWLNMGDSYAGSGKGRNIDGTAHEASLLSKQGSNAGTVTGNIQGGYTPEGLKPKDLMGVPWRLAFALQDDGYYLRQDIIWHKTNPMPESVTDRCTKSHEYIFLLSKSSRYYFDHEAIKEPLANASIGRAGRKQNLIDREGVGTLGKQILSGVNQDNGYAGLAQARNGKTGYDLEYGMRSKRSVWSVSVNSFSGAHFATFPEELIIPCVKAGCPKGGLILDPFMGAGTTALVAESHGRNYVGFELNPDYIKIAQKRIDAAFGMWANK